VLTLCGIVRVVPVADVDEVDRPRGQAARPLDQLSQRPRGRLRSEQAGRLRVADVQQVRQRIVRADRVDEVTLQALRDQDRRQLTPVACAQDAALANPVVEAASADADSKPSANHRDAGSETRDDGCRRLSERAPGRFLTSWDAGAVASSANVDAARAPDRTSPSPTCGGTSSSSRSTCSGAPY